ncbi:MAG: polysaccharide biosynthesis C-terminal domain-containing protein [Clostridia bacterium]|nr:polysaccharide biosynthesis C-terminal domain-containing protein [Clostridia bacterium]
MQKARDKKELFEKLPVPTALATMVIPTIISQLINLVYNMVDAFFIGRTGNSYMVAATSLTLTLVMMNTALSNLFGVGGGSLAARLMGASQEDECRKVSAFSVYGAAAVALLYSLLIGTFLRPVLFFLGASDETINYASQYTLLVIVIGSVFSMLSMTAAHLLRNAGYSSQASMGLSLGGLLNMGLDPLFMFVLLPKGQEVVGAALATLLSNVVSCGYLLFMLRKASATAPLSLRLPDARKVKKSSVKQLFSVGIPSAILTGLFDLANVCVNMLASAHSDMVLAGMGIVMKVERIPTAINLGICQGAMPIIAYNYSSGNLDRMKKTVSTVRVWGLAVSGVAIILFQIFAGSVMKLFMSTKGGNVENALLTIGYATLFLRIRCIASPMQFINYHTSYCMQAMGNGKATMLHAIVRELVFYIPCQFIMNGIWAETGLACALPVGEFCGALFALWLLKRNIKQ